MNLKVSALFIISMALPMTLSAGPNRNSYNLVPKCTESDGRYRWEVQNKTAAIIPYQLVATDNNGATISGSALATGSGDGSATDRTLTWSTRTTGGINFELRINGETYRKNANTSTCAAAVTKVDICHIPPGNPANAHVISVGHPAYAAHEAHGDVAAPCPVLAANPCSSEATMADCAAQGVLH